VTDTMNIDNWQVILYQNFLEISLKSMGSIGVLEADVNTNFAGGKSIECK